MMLLPFLLACAVRGPVVSEGQLERPVEVQVVPAGELQDGRFKDRRYGWELPIPEGWVATAGPDAGLMRVSLAKVATEVRVEVWVFPGGGDLSARQREGCMWSYQDQGHFTALEGAGAVHTATCVPLDPTGPRIYATITRRAGQILQVEVHAPADGLVAAKEEGDSITRGLIW